MYLVPHLGHVSMRSKGRYTLTNELPYTRRSFPTSPHRSRRWSWLLMNFSYFSLFAPDAPVMLMLVRKYLTTRFVTDANGGVVVIMYSLMMNAS